MHLPNINLIKLLTQLRAKSMQKSVPFFSFLLLFHVFSFENFAIGDDRVAQSYNMTRHETNLSVTNRNHVHTRAPVKHNNCKTASRPGTVCADGSIFAGYTPDGNVPMFTTRADTAKLSWNDGTINWRDIPGLKNCLFSEVTCDAGESNTSMLVKVDKLRPTYPHFAAQHCSRLNAHGHSDWYLPAKSELNVLFLNRLRIGSFDNSGSFPSGWYRSSSEASDYAAWVQRFSDGSQHKTSKFYAFSVRCVRK